MKTWDKPQHIKVLEREIVEVRRFDRNGFLRALGPENKDLFRAVFAGKYDSDQGSLALALYELGLNELAATVTGGKWFSVEEEEREVERWVWVDPLDPRVDPMIRAKAATQRASRRLVPAPEQ